MSWADRRKLIYILSFLIIISIPIAFTVIPLLNKKKICTPTDCGGVCAKLCIRYNDPFILWTRWSKTINTGTYNILAFGQNPNIGAGATSVPFGYKIYDVQGLLLKEGSGLTYIPPLNNFVIFSDGIFIGDKIPARIDFKLSTTTIVWQKISGMELGITAVSKNLVNEDTNPKLYVTLKNSTLNPIQNIESYAILYDENNNAIAFSRTKTDVINKNSTADIVFTWPDKFSGKIIKIDVISEVLQN
jgi:hypothetical protein